MRKKRTSSILENRETSSLSFGSLPPPEANHYYYSYDETIREIEPGWDGSDENEICIYQMLETKHAIHA